jgi:probable rRNA maturation factor
MMDDTQLDPDSPYGRETKATVWRSDADNIIELNYDASLWPDDLLAEFSALSAHVLDHIDVETGGEGICLGLLLADDAHICALNARFRGIERPTNVLSFPEPDDVPVNREAVDEGPEFVGEIAIAFETTEREAKELGIPFRDHLTHLFVHGVMHLLGYDHETESDAVEMEAMESAILAAFSIADPYAAMQRAADREVVS